MTGDFSYQGEMFDVKANFSLDVQRPTPDSLPGGGRPTKATGPVTPVTGATLHARITYDGGAVARW